MARAPISIPPDVRGRLKRLGLTARRAIGDRGIGAHASRSRGAGLEFAQYRAYEPGDEPRQIDWKLYARSDKFFVREAERESPVAVWILIDASASMAQADRATPAWSRFDAAAMLAACVAELAMQQDDRFGWIVLSDTGMALAEPRGGRRQRDRLLVDLARAEASGRFPDASKLAPLWERIGPNDLVLLLSDCFDDAGVALVERLAKAGRDVLAIQLLTVEERDFPFDGGFRFRDAETDAELIGDGAALRETYLARFAAARAALDDRLDAAGIRHTRYILDEPIDRPLHALFGRAGGAAG
ncbi:DUF58 domain-containing protein [Sphingomonas suaedae]|uniref:DUF58 domain-containing protein n=1 Tax=Sphingomonas suaedae TaxID=2599297 RepID=A0A518RDZ8_9SPHN|nr:DUF58 domain-containing protein [Sphingomonas suaedae]QDX25634.1 DUF58 domain-containing protein [Sphingomonas suaedae]